MRVPGESTLDLVELWRFNTGGPNSWDWTTPHLYVTGGKVIISYAADEKYGDKNSDSILTALSAETGQVIWQTRLVDPWCGTAIDSSHLADERLYLLYSFRVNAFSLETGELLWSTPDPERPGGGTGYWFNPWDSDDPLLWHSTEEELIALDPRTGEILWRREETGPEKGPMIQGEQFDFVNRYEDGLYTALRQNGQVSWVKVRPWPSFIGGDMLFEVGAPCYDIIRTNVQTGRVIWETSKRDYLSNFALSGSRAYALREDLTLVAFDLDSGAIVGTLKFDGSPADLICAKGGSGSISWVVADGPYVLVYFGDSRELIVLKEKSTQ